MLKNIWVRLLLFFWSILNEVHLQDQKIALNKAWNLLLLSVQLAILEGVIMTKILKELLYKPKHLN